MCQDHASVPKASPETTDFRGACRVKVTGRDSRVLDPSPKKLPAENLCRVGAAVFL